MPSSASWLPGRPSSASAERLVSAEVGGSFLELLELGVDLVDGALFLGDLALAESSDLGGELLLMLGLPPLLLGVGPDDGDHRLGPELTITGRNVWWRSGLPNGDLLLLLLVEKLLLLELVLVLSRSDDETLGGVGLRPRLLLVEPGESLALSLLGLSCRGEGRSVGVHLVSPGDVVGDGVQPRADIFRLFTVNPS